MATPERPDHYFVVAAVWNDDRQGYDLLLDDDTLTARFHDGQAWNGSEWTVPTGRLSDLDSDLLHLLGEILSSAGVIVPTPESE